MQFFIDTATQALLAANAGARYISPFVGRYDDIATAPMKVLKKCLHHPLTDTGIAAIEAGWERVARV